MFDMMRSSIPLMNEVQRINIVKIYTQAFNKLPTIQSFQ